MSQEAYTALPASSKMDGILIVEQDLVRVSDLTAGVRVYSVPATRLAEELGKRMVLNSVMVGFFGAVTRAAGSRGAAQRHCRFGAGGVPRSQSAGI